MITINSIKVRVFVRVLALFLLALPSFSSIANEKISIYIDGQIQPLLTDPLGLKAGVIESTGELSHEMSGVGLNLGSSRSAITINNPYSGTYNITLHGTYEENITISISYLDTNRSFAHEVELMGLFHGGTISFDFVLDPQLEQAISVLPNIEPVVNLALSENNGMGVLTWEASTAPDFSKYHVYAKSEQDAFFEFVTDVTSPTYNTNNSIRTDQNGEKWQYIVTVIANDGSESFYNDVQSNLLKTRSYFSVDTRSVVVPFTVQFSDESVGEPTSWAWDFNGDNIIDSTAQNPQFTYDTAGIYDVSQTVSGAFGSDTNTKNAYIFVDIDTDGDGEGDNYETARGLDPNLVDSDGDGLVDGKGGVVSLIDYPSGIDNDLDGYVDGEQDIGTSPGSADSDGDGINDGDELTDGTDPLDTSSFNALANGDINDDGIVNAADGLIATQILLNIYSPSLAEQARWDVAPLVGGVPNSDGENNLGDYVVLMRIILGTVTF